MVVKRVLHAVIMLIRLRVVLSHMVVKPGRVRRRGERGLRVVLSHMVVKLPLHNATSLPRLRVVLSHMVVKHTTTTTT